MTYLDKFLENSLLLENNLNSEVKTNIIKEE